MGEREGPLFSTRAEEPSLVEAIEDFVVGVAERVDHLQDAEGEGDLRRVARLARELATEADAVGYELLGQVARGVCMAAQAEKSEEVRDLLLALTATTHRVRLGHPGAF